MLQVKCQRKVHVNEEEKEKTEKESKIKKEEAGKL